MVDINSGEKNNESNEKQKNKKKLSKNEFLTHFKIDVNRKEESAKIVFFNTLLKSRDISSVKWYIETFQRIENNYSLSQNDNASEIWSFDISKITLSDLNNIFTKELISIKSKRNLLINKIAKDFLIPDNKKTQLEDKINLLNESELKLYIFSEVKLRDFIKQNWDFQKNIVNSLSLFNFSSQEINKRLEKLEPSHMLNNVKIILLNISEWKIKDSEIKEIFSTNFFTDSEKKQLVLDFIPIVSLQQLLDIWFYSKEEAENEKIKIINNFYTFSDKKITKKTISSIELKDIIIDINSINLTLDSISKIWEKIWFKNLEDDFNYIISDINSQNKNNWPQTFEYLKIGLADVNKNWKIKNIEKFKSEDSFIEIIIKDEKWNTKNSFLKVKKTDDDKKNIEFLEVWANNVLDLSSNTQKELTYSDFFHISWKENISIVFHKEQDLKDKVKSWDLTTTELVTFSNKDLENEENKKYYSQKFRESKKEELDKLTKEQENWTLSNLDRERMNSLELIVNWWNIEDEELLDFLNFEELLSKINSIDPDWKDLKLEKWLALLAEDWWLHEITWLSNWKFSVKSKVKPLEVEIHDIDYNTFFNSFKDLKIKRLKYIKDFWEILNDFEKKWWDKWKWFSFENNELSIKQENNKNSDKKVNFLVSDNENDIIKIHNISWDKITVSFWERKTRWNLDKKDKNFKEKSDEDVLYIEWAEEITLNLNEFKAKYLDDEKYWFRPSWETGKSLKNVDDVSENKFKWSFFTRIFNWASIYELLSWWKILLNSIQDTLKRWNDLKAARFALSIWWFLPEELRAELQIKLEREEWESMDKALDWLWKVDSWIAVNRIKSWLEYKDTPEYKKEAWLLFMLSKYWHLTSKWALYEFRWKYLWYEAFGWKVWDELFLEKKKECLDWWLTFSEEYLVHSLLKKQCWWQWHNWIKRRSRLHKEYEWKWGAWLREELEKWHSDASKKRKASDMVKWWMDEATWWTTTNAIWWFKKAIERWWSIEDMSEWFFCLLYSWACYDLDQKTYLSIRDLWWSGMPILMTKFFSTLPEMSMFNDTILELSKEIWKAYPDKFPTIAKEAQDLYDSAKNKKWSEKERLTKTQQFWKNYSTPLSRSLNMLNTDDWTYSKTDKILFLKKDENPVLWNMYNKIREVSSEWGTFKADFMWDACWSEWLSWLDVYRVVIKFLEKSQSWGFRDKDTWPLIWQKISEDLKSTKNKVFSDDKKKDLELKRKYLLQTLREIIWWIVSISWSNLNSLNSYDNLSTETWVDFNNWWLKISDFSEFSASIILKWYSDKNSDKDKELIAKIDSILIPAVDNILSWRVDFSKSSNKIESVFDDIKSSVDTQLPKN